VPDVRVAPNAAAIHAATLTLAKALLSRRSLTPDDGGCLDLIAARLAGRGFSCERLDRRGVRNLWARRGTTAPLVCFAGHLDVVPPGPVEQWTTDPFTPTERDGSLYARGAVDMKGPLAAAITAVERFVDSNAGHTGSIALLLTSDEEGAATDGTVAVVEALLARHERIDQCVVAESTSVTRLGDTVKNGRRGSLIGTLTVHGVQCHIAYPHLGRNPIHQAAPALAELVATTWDEGDDYFQPTAFQISNIHAGTGATNVIPGALTVQFNFRFSPQSTVDALKSRVVEVLDRHGLEYDLEWSVIGQAFLTPRGPLVEVLRDVVQAVTGVSPELSTSGGTSDARFIAAIANEVVEFGPVNASMHQIDEHITLADLAPLSRIYEGVLRRVLEGDRR
jgi:succinyl-diaminopimelate desuccinylase